MRFDGKRTKQILKTITLTEYSAVTTPAQEGAVAVLMKAGAPDPKAPKAPGAAAPTAPLVKGSSMLMTSSEEGHQHIVRLWDDERGGTTGSSVIEIEGAGAVYHDHAYLLGTDGTITIGETLGHSHEVDSDSVVAAVFSMIKGATGDPKQPGHSGAGKESKMAVPEKTVPTVDMQKSLDRANAIAAMTPGHFAYHKTLAGDEAEAFVVLTEAQREALVTKIEKAKTEADPVVYTSKATGRSYRKSQEDLAEFAKRDDARELEMQKLRDENAVAAFEKRAAEELPHLPGDVKVRGLLVKAIEGIADETARSTVWEMIKSKEASRSAAFRKVGHTGADEETVFEEGAPLTDADEKLEKLAADYAKEHKLTIPAAYAKVIQTAEGRRLYAAEHGGDPN